MLSHKKLDELTIVSFTGVGHYSGVSKTTSFLVGTGSESYKRLLKTNYYYYEIDGKNSEVVAPAWTSKVTTETVLEMEDGLQKGLTGADFIYDYIDEKDYPGTEEEDVYSNFVKKVIDEAKNDIPFVVYEGFKIKKELLEEFEILLDRFIYKGER